MGHRLQASQDAASGVGFEPAELPTDQPLNLIIQFDGESFLAPSIEGSQRELPAIQGRSRASELASYHAEGPDRFARRYRIARARCANAGHSISRRWPLVAAGVANAVLRAGTGNPGIRASAHADDACPRLRCCAVGP